MKAVAMLLTSGEHSGCLNWNLSGWYIMKRFFPLVLSCAHVSLLALPLCILSAAAFISWYVWDHLSFLITFCASQGARLCFFLDAMAEA